MALNIKNATVETLVAEVAAMTGESKTEVIRKAVLDRKARLTLNSPPEDRKASVMRFLEREVWPQIPAALLGKGIHKTEREAILGYGPEGV
ncbi:MAG: protein transcription factor [Chloroflexi bacterium CFX6]|nr:protein transcription factor [Chloroflexi bacterium CFX6]